MQILGIDNIFFQVGNLKDAETYYQRLGFKVKLKLAHIPALLLSIGTERPGLILIEQVHPIGSCIWLEVPNAQEVEHELSKRYTSGKFLETKTGLTFEIEDPWGNRIGFADYRFKPELARRHERNITLYYLGIPVELPDYLDAFREMHDPKYAVNEAHATLVAPFPASLMNEGLSNHFKHEVAQFKRQKIIASDYEITSHGYIFFTFDPESAKLVHALYDRLYDHPALRDRKNQGHYFMPHITVAKFESERRIPRLIRSVLPELCAPYEFLFDRVRLYGILQEPRKREHVQDYFLAED